MVHSICNPFLFVVRLQLRVGLPTSVVPGFYKFLDMPASALHDAEPANAKTNERIKPGVLRASCPSSPYRYDDGNTFRWHALSQIGLVANFTWQLR